MYKWMPAGFTKATHQRVSGLRADDFLSAKGCCFRWDLHRGARFSLPNLTDVPDSSPQVCEVCKHECEPNGPFYFYDVNIFYLCLFFLCVLLHFPCKFCFCRVWSLPVFFFTLLPCVIRLPFAPIFFFNPVSRLTPHSILPFSLFFLFLCSIFVHSSCALKWRQGGPY